MLRGFSNEVAVSRLTRACNYRCGIVNEVVAGMLNPTEELQDATAELVNYASKPECLGFNARFLAAVADWATHEAEHQQIVASRNNEAINDVLKDKHVKASDLRPYQTRRAGARRWALVYARAAEVFTAAACLAS
jgi:hypothetical protein